jgi:transcriptional antiterminator RfaH
MTDHDVCIDFDTGSPWYVAHTKPRQEFTAVMNLQRQGYGTYVPMLRRWKKRQGEWQRIEEVFFPRYVFFSPGHPRQGLATIRSTIGVASLVSFGLAPATVGRDVLLALREMEQAAQQPEEGKAPAHPFAAGDAVRIDAGPLAGLVGIVAASGIERVAVMLSLLGRETRVECPAHALSCVA